MLLILSESGDRSTNDVIDWLEEYGVVWTRLNGDALNATQSITLHLDRTDECEPTRGIPPPEHVHVVWLRRWSKPMGGAGPEILNRNGVTEEPVDFHVNLSEFRSRELRTLTAFLFRQYRQCAWLGKPGTLSLNKLQVLEEAASCGLKVPPSVVTSSRVALERFASRHEHIVSKPIAEVALLALDDDTYLTYTSRCTHDEIAALPDTFFPALFQAEVAKACELRVFILGERTYAMAMFTQRRAETASDFRRYNSADPTRCVPYDLPTDIEAAIQRLMVRLSLVTGSVDMILTPSGDYVFLEINPAGQFGMTSYPCNYHIERDIADHIRRLVHDEGK